MGIVERAQERAHVRVEVGGVGSVLDEREEALALGVPVDAAAGKVGELALQQVGVALEGRDAQLARQRGLGPGAAGQRPQGEEQQGEQAGLLHAEHLPKPGTHGRTPR